MRRTRGGDPGYYLIAGGRRAFEAAIGFRPPLRTLAGAPESSVRHRRLCRRHRRRRAGPARRCRCSPSPPLGSARRGSACSAFSASIPAIDAAVALVNRAVAFGFGATLLPALELARRRSRASAHARRRADAADHAARPSRSRSSGSRSITSRARRATCISRCCPTGSTPATEHVDGDEALLAAAAEGIAELNRRYGPAPGGDALPAAASPARLERRRRALDRLGAQARQAARTEPAAARRDRHHLHRHRTAASPRAAADVRYVVTLDADTRLPRDTVRRLIGKMAHPLNRPRFDAAAGRVVEGYAVLQPRVTPSLPVGREGSLFQRIFSSLSGIDPYASAVSDVYQDLFGEGSYAGKGIYDVDAFEAALAGRVPDSTLLSHDLFEGVFARAGLASDVEVVEEFPAALRRRRPAPPPLGARRLAAAALDPRSRAAAGRRGPDGRSPFRRSAAGRCSTICAARCRRPRPSSPCSPDGRCRFDAALVWTVFVLVDDRAADPDSGHRRHRCRARRESRSPAICARSAPICASR